ncbi:Protein lap4, partial [Gryllus bimaculatus]
RYSTLPPSPAPPPLADEPDAYSSSEDLLDPIGRSRIPGARPPGRRSSPAEAAAPPPIKSSVSDRMKFFEKAMVEQHQPSPKPEKAFSFLSKDEVERMKQEEEKKIASLSRDELQSWAQLDEEDDNEDDDEEPRPSG